MSLEQVNLVLDIIIKLVSISVLIFLFLLLRNLDKAVQSLENSMESMERSAETIEDLLSLARYFPFVGGGRDDQ